LRKPSAAAFVAPAAITEATVNRIKYSADRCFFIFAFNVLLFYFYYGITVF
jgi:hypothetical protein